MSLRGGTGPTALHATTAARDYPFGVDNLYLLENISNLGSL
jgi:hypothetical protein